MLARVLSGAVLGIDAYLVGVEVDVANGLPSFSTVGLPQGAVKEGKERVVAAVQNSGYAVPPRRITVNLAPADVRKEGSAFDLPIAVGILAGSGQLRCTGLERFALVGELGLDGRLRPVRGALSIAMAARAAGLAGVIVPRANVAEAALVEGVEVRGAEMLGEVVRFLDGSAELETAVLDRAALFGDGSSYEMDFAEVRGQEQAKHALEVAAAGGHNILMVWRYPRDAGPRTPADDLEVFGCGRTCQASGRRSSNRVVGGSAYCALSASTGSQEILLLATASPCNSALKALGVLRRHLENVALLLEAAVSRALCRGALTVTHSCAHVAALLTGLFEGVELRVTKAHHGRTPSAAESIKGGGVLVLVLVWT